MKKIIYLLFFSITLLLMSAAWSAEQLQIIASGLSGDALKNVQTRLADLQKKNSQNLADVDLQQLSQQGQRQIEAALQAYAYFKPEIHSEIKQQNQQWIISYYVQPGDRLKIQTLDIQLLGPGQTNAELKKLLRHFPLQQGQPILTDQYNAAKNMLFDVAIEQGYLKAFMQRSEIQVDLKNYTAKVLLQFNTGMRYYFGAVHFTPTPYQTAFLQKFLDFVPGDPYSTDRVLQAQRNLTNSNYFTQVILQPQLEQTLDYQVPIDVFLIAKKSQQYNFGIGYGTDTGLRGTLGWEWRHITDTGHWFNAMLQGSERETNLSAAYTIPGNNPLTDQYTLGGFYKKEKPISNGQSIIKNLNAAYVTQQWGWQQTYAVNLQQERYQIVDGINPQNSLLLMPSITWNRTRSDNPVFVRNGYRVSINLRGAAKALLSDSNFIQTDIQAKYIRSFTESNRVLLRSEFGYTIVNNINDLPRSIRFFAGGTQSLRAYNYQALGPNRYLLTASAEYQQCIVGKWYGAIFYDAGNAFGQFPPNLQQAPGIGVLWASPVGTLELTLAKAINKAGQPMKIQFSMGTDL